MAQLKSASDSRIGQVIAGKYRVIRLIGQGGMGQVYEAIHTAIGRRFAIKCLHASHAQQEEILLRFRREAEAAGGIENENIAAAIDFGTLDDGSPYLVMEYLEGENLAQLLGRLGQLAIPRAAHIAIQVCRGLAAAHARGIVHRDLKPENLFIGKRNDGTDLVKILDFGIAKLHTDVALTQAGAAMGTPSYMSVEQARGARDVDLRTDVYALGVILYEMLAGQKPHPGNSYNEILYHVISETPVPLGKQRPGLPGALAAAVHRAMAKEASDRFASARDFARELEPFAERAIAPEAIFTPGALSLAETVPSPASLPAIAGIASTGKSSASPTSRRRIFVIAAIVVVTAGVNVLFVLGRRSHTTASASPSVTSEGPRATAGNLAPVPHSNQTPGVVPATMESGPAADAGGSLGAEKRPDGRTDEQPVKVAPKASTAASSRKAFAKPSAAPGDKTRAFDRNNPYSD